MFELNLRQWQDMQKAVRNEPVKVSYASWRQIAREFELTDIDGAKKWLYLSSDDFKLLRQDIKARYGLDLLFDEVDGSRIELANKTYKEKLAPTKPDDDYLLCRLPTAHPISQLMPVAASLRLPLEQVLLQLNTVTSVLVVENLDIFDQLESCQLPLDMSCCLVLYRGSTIHSPKAVKTLLENIPADCQIVAFTDIDPAGLQIAISLRAKALICPQNMAELFELGQCNDPEDFNKQYKQLYYLQSCLQDENLSLDMIQLIEYINENKVSVKQQHLFAHNISLNMITIR